MDAKSPRLQYPDPTHVGYRGKTYLFFGGCDYFRLAWNPRIRRRLSEAARHGPISAAASRKTTGDREIYRTLESALARYFQSESCLLTSSGYLANTVAAQALAEQPLQVFMDEASHGSLRDACLQWKATPRFFKHCDPVDLRRRLRRTGSRRGALILTDGLFAHDGREAPVQEYLNLVGRKGWVLVDDAHGAFVLGSNGRGTAEGAKDEHGRLIRTISFSKAMGLFGGAVLCARTLKERAVQRSRAFVGSTPPPLPLAEAAMEALKELTPPCALRKSLCDNLLSVRQSLADASIALPAASGPALFLHPKYAPEVRRMRGKFLAHGIYPPFVRYADFLNEGYYRVVVSSAHSKKELAALAKCLIAILK